MSAPRNTRVPAFRQKLGIAVMSAALLFLAGAIVLALLKDGESPADPDNAEQVARGKPLYDKYCAACHGARLEGQVNWRLKLPNGRMPAPPHDASGHTWHHPDAILFGITKHGPVPGKYAPPNSQSDMPGFEKTLSDQDIWAVLAYIKSSWPPDIRETQRKIDSRRKR
ncbi:MAG: c-type cytochrome [Betaproteobacteria bacterium]|nr:c-type cytochrome [Betaproteobacteria bacterium]MDH3436186.1 c-type cytochrome [Betaproteobacteria bacterium]